MGTTPLVTVCIPAYNSAATIRRCLDAILTQDLTDAEILLVDNCSEDATVAIADECLRPFLNTKIIKNRGNLGRVANWNRCAEEAQGQYVKYVLTNDVLLPGSLRLLVESIDADQCTVIGASQSKTVTEMPDPLPTVADSLPSIQRSSDETLELFAGHGFLTGSLNGMIYRRRTLLEHRIVFREDIPYFADFYHAIQLARHGAAVFLDGPTYCFDASAKGRYHFVGMKDPRAFFLEQRTCTIELASLLRERGRSDRSAYAYLLGRYFYYLGQGAELGSWDAFHIFAGWPRLQLKAMAKTLWYRFRHPTPEKAPA